MPAPCLSLISLLCWSLSLVLGSAPAVAEEGQYRSRILITPESTMTEGAGLSIEELERQIGSIEQPYARSSAERHLARHYVEQGEYDRAGQYYRSALAAGGLSDVANREMLRELAQVYLLQDNFAQAARTLEQALAIDLVPDVTDYLLLAQAQYRMKKYVSVVATLDQIEAAALPMTAVQLRQALALYYQAGAYEQCERLLQQLLQSEPHDAQSWHQLVSVYLQQNKRKQALNQLSLAREKGVPFREADTMLLVDLHAANKNPYGAAEILAQALAAKQLARNAANYRKLFELWFQAREKERAAKALQQAARLGNDTELYLYLAQLQMDERQWQAMHGTMLAACAGELQDRFVGRANLLLGISQLKLGDESAARRSFINATLIGGVNAQAGQWLQFMNAAPATEREARRIEGICYGASDKQLQVAQATGSPVDADSASAGDGGQDIQGQDIAVKTVPPMRLFYARYDMSLEQLAQQLSSLAPRMGVSLVKAGGSVDGPMHLIRQADPAVANETARLELAFPSGGSPRASGRFKVRSAKSFKCAWLSYEGPADGLLPAALGLAQALPGAGYEASGEQRLLFSNAAGKDQVKVEIQLGIL